jgi:hypothetical protein
LLKLFLLLLKIFYSIIHVVKTLQHYISSHCQQITCWVLRNLQLLRSSKNKNMLIEKSVIFYSNWICAIRFQKSLISKFLDKQDFLTRHLSILEQRNEYIPRKLEVIWRSGRTVGKTSWKIWQVRWRPGRVSVGQEFDWNRIPVVLFLQQLTDLISSIESKLYELESRNKIAVALKQGNHISIPCFF